MRTRSCLPKIVMLATLLTACGGDEADSPATPTSPTTPPVHASVAGRWTVTDTVESAAGVSGGGCLGDLVRANVPTTETGTLTLAQDGRTVTGMATFPDDGTTCPFTGAVTGDSLELTSSSCQPETIELGIVPGCGEQGWTLELTGRTFSGTVDETTIAGRGTETGNAMSGGDTYPITVTSSVTMRR